MYLNFDQLAIKVHSLTKVIKGEDNDRPYIRLVPGDTTRAINIYMDSVVNRNNLYREIMAALEAQDVSSHGITNIE